MSVSHFNTSAFSVLIYIEMVIFIHYFIALHTNHSSADVIHGDVSTTSAARSIMLFIASLADLLKNLSKALFHVFQTLQQQY
jgi:hypothetical protein